MQIRFREYNKDENKYKLISLFNCEDYSEMFKLLKYMMDEKHEFAIEYNDADEVETVPDHCYTVKSVSLVTPKILGELWPHISVDIEEIF